MNISRFTRRELDEFRRECNFTDMELACFDLKAKNCSNVELSMKLNISDSTVSATMRSVRAKITAVLEDKASDKAKKLMPVMPTNPAITYLVDFLKTILADTPFIPESHTTKEWAELPDRISIKDKWYVVSDYRTDDDVSVPRFKFGDGITPISKLPFVTAAITDNDVLWWDLKAQKVQ